MTLITTTSELDAFCRGLAGADYITVDTEFLREKTYYPQLCLIQVAGPDGAVAIDPLAEGIDLTSLLDVLVDPNVLKVFHAARQDVEIFFHLTGKIPHPLFDTQVAAMVCGFGESVGYETLVTKLAGARIDKSSRFTDWSARPLTERQLTYALSDVIHLRPAFEKLRKRLNRTGRAHWLEEEMAVLTNPATYTVEPDTSWQRLKVRTNKPRFMAILKELAAWREREAQRRDLPRSRVLRDEALLEIAAHAPTTVDDLARTRGMGRGFAEGKQG
ncbi:ribonuclease D, partial [Azospirillum sp.]|uniref:ribonuclease D n=1 Tax=Azospirillum sp. TaxID=34012 RepID=UPI002D57C647